MRLREQQHHAGATDGSADQCSDGPKHEDEGAIKYPLTILELVIVFRSFKDRKWEGNGLFVDLALDTGMKPVSYNGSNVGASDFVSAAKNESHRYPNEPWERSQPNIILSLREHINEAA